MEKPRLVISFSGGRSSAVMTYLCLRKYSKTHDIKVIFANTGWEHEDTLEFIRDCDKNWGFGTIWLEGVFSPVIGEGVQPKVVTYETANRTGGPFEAAVAKHGVFNYSRPGCSYKLKKEVIEAYLRSMGWKTGEKGKDHDTAIGIRADEIDRQSSKAKERRIVYPLVDLGWTKDMVDAFMRRYPWDLKLPSEAYGNCKVCWKKSLRKLMTIAQEAPEEFSFPMRLEKEYGHIGVRKPGQRYTFYREERSAADILEMSKTEKFTPYKDSSQLTIWDESLDLGGACSESCEIDSDEE